MNLTLNKVTLIGKVVGIAEKVTSHNITFTQLELETKNIYQQEVKSLDIHAISLWGDMHANAQNKLRLGKYAMVIGKLKSRKVDTRDGSHFWATNITGTNFYIIENEEQPIVEQQIVQKQSIYEIDEDDIPF